MSSSTLYQIFRSGSTTYFYSSLFFPPQMRGQVFQLYGFVRIVDNFVDAVPQQRDSFYSFWDEYSKQAGVEMKSVRKTDQLRFEKRGLTEVEQEVLDQFLELRDDLSFPEEWITAFMKAMESDLYKSKYNSLRELEAYMFGSAEVIGLFMSKVMRLDPASYNSARALGRAMQYINFVRDVREDEELGRQYIPLEVMQNSSMSAMTQSQATDHPQEFQKVMKNEAARFKYWQTQAESGYSYIPTRFLIPIKTASDMYLWTAEQISQDPSRVWKEKIKPSKWRVMATFVKNAVTLYVQRWFRVR